MATHRREVRPRYGRIVAAATSLTVTVLAALAGFGLVPSSAGPGDTARPAASPRDRAPADQPNGAAGRAAGDRVDEAAGAEPAALESEAATPAERRRVTAADLLPADSGEGRRVVYSEGQQRVWLLDEDNRVRRTYLVSGSVHDNLDPGTYQVYSRSLNAIGIDDSGTMRYFVRFTQGDTGAAIGFHDIPVDDGVRVQTVADLGEPTSHGCIRQRTADAEAMWAFGQLGTTVVVTP